MNVKQLSIFIENKSGRLAEVLELLGNENINVVSMNISDTPEYGILRLLVSHPDKAYNKLKENKFSVNIIDVLTIYLSAETCSGARILRLLSDENVSIEYIYAFNWGKKAIFVMRTDEKQKALRIIENNKLEIVKQEDLIDPA